MTVDLNKISGAYARAQPVLEEITRAANDADKLSKADVEKYVLPNQQSLFEATFDAAAPGQRRVIDVFKQSLERPGLVAADAAPLLRGMLEAFQAYRRDVEQALADLLTSTQEPQLPERIQRLDQAFSRAEPVLRQIEAAMRDGDGLTTSEVQSLFVANETALFEASVARDVPSDRTVMDAVQRLLSSESPVKLEPAARKSLEGLVDRFQAFKTDLQAVIDGHVEALARVEENKRKAEAVISTITLADE